MANAIAKRIYFDLELKQRLMRAYSEAGKPISYQGFYGWLKKGIPPERVGILASVTGWPYYEIRPDLFPRDLPRRRVFPLKPRGFSNGKRSDGARQRVRSQSA
jgi:hypothetical protein